MVDEALGYPTADQLPSAAADTFMQFLHLVITMITSLFNTF